MCGCWVVVAGPQIDKAGCRICPVSGVADGTVSRSVVGGPDPVRVIGHSADRSPRGIRNEPGGADDVAVEILDGAVAVVDLCDGRRGWPVKVGVGSVVQEQGKRTGGVPEVLSRGGADGAALAEPVAVAGVVDGRR